MTHPATLIPPLHPAAIVQSSLDAIIGRTLDGVIASWNPAAERMFGYPAAEAVGQPITLIIPPDRREEEITAVASLGRGERVEHFETVRQTRDGRALTVSLAISPVADASGALVGVATIARDVTAQRRAAEEVTRSLERLARTESLAGMSDLLAGVAHEINNPLAIVLGQTALLGQGAPKPIQDRAEKIRVAAERCARVIRNFLALARQRPLDRAAVDLNHVVTEAVELLGYELKTGGVSISLDLAPDLPRVWGDGHRLHQVMLNLLVNACHALRPMTSARRLTISTRLDDAGRARLEVADNGPGIPAAVLPRVFDPFFTTRPPGEGTGLGLSLCRHIVEEHAGTITVASEPGRGARFVIDLPPASPAVLAAVGTPSTSGVATRRARILVVDDEVDIAVILRDALEVDGHAADVADSGATALEMLAGQSYDLLLADATIELFHAVERRLPQYRDRLIFITGDTVSRDQLQFLEQTGVPVILKPFDVCEVQDLVRRLLARRRGEARAVGASQPANAWWRARARVGTE
jgi:PAS domain S-box-containing protein